MKYLLFLIVISLSLSSCFFTSQVIKDERKASAIPSNSYSLNRAYYSKDGFLHLDFTNDHSHRSKMNYYSVSINIYGILSEYEKMHQEIVDFDKKITRAYDVIAAAPMSRSCNCAEAYNYRNGIEVDCKEIRVDYFRTLPKIEENRILKSAGTIDVNCCWAMTGEDLITDASGAVVEPVNKPTVLFVVPTAKRFGDFAAIRLPLRNHKTKLGRLSIALLLDIVTSPVQLGIEILKQKSDSIDAVNARKR